MAQRYRKVHPVSSHSRWTSRNMQSPGLGRGRQRLVVASGYQEREIRPRSGGCVITWSAAAAVLGPGRQSSHRPARAGAAAGLPWRANQAECRCRRLPKSPSRGFSRPSAGPVRDPYSTCGCKPSCSGVKQSGNWAERRKDRDWPEAACVIVKALSRFQACSSASWAISTPSCLRTSSRRAAKTPMTVSTSAASCGPGELRSALRHRRRASRPSGAMTVPRQHRAVVSPWSG
jgi:hypothetical protein